MKTFCKLKLKIARWETDTIDIKVKYIVKNILIVIFRKKNVYLIMNKLKKTSIIYEY